MGSDASDGTRVRHFHSSEHYRLIKLPPSGYLASCKSIVTATKSIERSIRDEIPKLYILGNPPASVIAFGAREESGISVMEVGDAMAKKGWHLNSLQNPPSVHICCTVSPVRLRDVIR